MSLTIQPSMLESCLAGMKSLLSLMLMAMVSAPAWAQTSHKPVTQHRSSKHKRSARKSGPSYQLHPDPERYQEIQKALADRGYFKGEVNGQWGDDSVDALKRFQADQKLPDDGKINSLSLIGLGLGPKHNGSTVASGSGAVPLVPEPPLPASEPPPSSASDNSPR